jgi:hypothetical protein
MTCTVRYDSIEELTTQLEAAQRRAATDKVASQRVILCPFPY